MDNKLNFVNRIVVFIDILGFGDLVEQAAKDPDGKANARLSLALKTIQILGPRSVDELSPLKNAKPHVQIFSDSVIFSVEPSPEFTKQLFLELGQLFVRLMMQGVWIRGGISFGKISTNLSSPCGPAVNSAYKIESQIASSPRIALAGSMVKYCRENAPAMLNLPYCTRDGDGVFAISPLDIAQDQALEREFRLDIRNHAKTIRDHLDRSLEQIVERPDHYKKINQLADKWNIFADQKRGFFTKSFRTKGYVDFVDAIEADLNKGL